MKTRSIVTIVAALGVFALAAVAFAGPYGHGGGHGSMMGGYGKGSVNCPYGGGQGMGSGYNSLTPEKQAEYDKIVAEADKEMTPLRESLFAKQAELNAMYNNPNADPAAVGKVAGEVAKLRTQMRNLHIELSDRLEKEVGLQSGFKRGHRGGGFHGSGGFGCN
ncbi:periplasmic heavy metal sensor [Oleidesulfovibrio sp.]|uniref:periplasmic heavy metal sensor n=1 Tax=Oleidesulfovibrio sp. TaxID=2909707 RepID=UPI003A8B165E